MPNENLIYFADTKYTPYGEKPNGLITQRVKSIGDFFASKKVKALVVACNTATAAAINDLRQQYDIPIIGLEPALKPAINASKNNLIGVIATQSTLESEKYLTLKSHLIDANDAHLKIIEKASNYFVELVESAAEIDQQVHRQVANELQPFIDASIDTLVLGCTHYPFLTHLIQQILGNKVKLLESGLPVAKELQRRIFNQFNPQTCNGLIEYYSSDPQKSKASFNAVIGEAVNLQEAKVK